MYANPSHGGNTGARWAEIQRQEADHVAALQAEIVALKSTVRAQAAALESFEEGSYIVVTAHRDSISPDVEGSLTLDRANYLAKRRRDSLLQQGLRQNDADVTVYHVGSRGHVHLVANHF